MILGQLFKKSIFVLACAAAVVATNSEAKAFQCNDLFRAVPISKQEIGEGLEKIGFADYTYISRWRVKNAEQAGPFPLNGELMVSGVRTADINRWMDEVGSRTIGLMVDGLPEKSPGTGVLRVGRDLYSHGMIGAAWDQDTSADFITTVGYGKRYTEATFAVTPSEMAAIKEFLLARNKGIKAKFDVPRGPRRGEDIRPEFDSHKFSLGKESCAGACSSFMDPKWLAHYDGPGKETLETLAQRLQLEPTFVAKQLIWGHARNPGTAAITMIGIDRSTKYYKQNRNGDAVEAHRPDLTQNFIEKNSWGPLRGLQIHALIPDPKSGESGTISAERIPLADWLNQARNNQ